MTSRFFAAFIEEHFFDKLRRERAINFSKLTGISLVFWATELDTSLSSSICQPASICRYRARGLSLFRGDKVKTVIELDDLSSSMTYRARWPIELGDLSSSVFQEKKEREKMEIKAIITTWSTKSKTPSRSQFVTDKKHCVADRLMLFWYFKKYRQKNILFLSSLIYLTRDYRPSTARELNDLILNRIHLKKF